MHHIRHEVLVETRTLKSVMSSWRKKSADLSYTHAGRRHLTGVGQSHFFGFLLWVPQHINLQMRKSNGSNGTCIGPKRCFRQGLSITNAVKTSYSWVSVKINKTPNGAMQQSQVSKFPHMRKSCRYKWMSVGPNCSSKKDKYHIHEQKTTSHNNRVKLNKKWAMHRFPHKFLSKSRTRKSVSEDAEILTRNVFGSSPIYHRQSISESYST